MLLCLKRVLPIHIHITISFLKQSLKIFAIVAAASMEDDDFTIIDCGTAAGGKNSRSLFFRFCFILFDQFQYFVRVSQTSS